MRSILTLVAFVTYVSASITPRQVPPNCTTGCIAKGDQTGCSNAGDINCWCKSGVWATGVMKCLAEACPPADVTAAQDAVRTTCRLYGVQTLGGSTATATGGSSGSTGTSSGSGASPSRTTTSNAAVSNGVNALAGVAAVGLALVL